MDGHRLTVSAGSNPGRIVAHVTREPLPASCDQWWSNLQRELDALTDAQVELLAHETDLIDGTVGDGLAPHVAAANATRANR